MRSRSSSRACLSAAEPRKQTEQLDIMNDITAEALRTTQPYAALDRQLPEHAFCIPLTACWILELVFATTLADQKGLRPLWSDMSIEEEQLVPGTEPTEGKRNIASESHRQESTSPSQASDSKVKEQFGRAVVSVPKKPSCS